MSRRPPGRRPPTLRRAARAAALLLVVAASARCATAGGSRTPLPDPSAAAARLAEVSPDRPYRVTFRWQYADERGPVRGDGVLRFNPPDSLRLDLFSAGDASMNVALVDGQLRTAGQIEDVRLPPPAFLYATAGLFRPGREGPAEGWQAGEDRLLSYESPARATLVYRLRGTRIVGLVERSGDRELRTLELDWPEPAGDWPRQAEYRDETQGSRARWTVEDAETEEESFPREIYELPQAP